MWIYLATLISILTILLVIAMIWHIKNLVLAKELYSIIPLKRYLVSKEFKNIKSGDIIYTRSSIASFQELVIPYIYKHVAIIVEFDDKLYIADTSNGGVMGRKKNKLIRRTGGVNMYPLHKWLKYSLGPVFILKLNKPLTEKKNIELYDTIIDKYGEPYPTMLDLYILFTLHIPIKTTLYCHTLLWQCLINMGLVDNQRKSAYELGKFITSISKYQLNDGYEYDHPRQLIYDYECNDELF